MAAISASPSETTTSRSLAQNPSTSPIEPAETPSPQKSEAPEPPKAPNFLFIVIDALRADHLGYDGYERSTSANLDALAERGVVFSQARSTGTSNPLQRPLLHDRQVLH